MHLIQALFKQGFGTRRACTALVQRGEVFLSGQPCTDPLQEVDTHNLTLVIQGVVWPYRDPAIIALNKPAGYECSRQPQQYPSVLSLLPEPLRRRNVQPVGRLDADTTGLLLLTDDGALIHKLTSPKHHVPKVYQVGCKHPVSDQQLEQLINGVVLNDDPEPVCAQSATHLNSHHIQLTITHGKYHQVKRMIAAVGNRVESLHRLQIGHLQLAPELKPSQWNWVDLEQILPHLPPQ